MNSFQSNRSVPLMLIVLGILAVSIIALYALPTIIPSSDCSEFSGDCQSVTFGDASEIIRYGYEDGWVIDLARLGAIVIVAATIGFTFDQRRYQVIAIAAGAVAMFVLSAWIFKHRGEDSIGFGIILYTLGITATAYIGILYPTPGAFLRK
jgi:hypothetical protein